MSLRLSIFPVALFFSICLSGQKGLYAGAGFVDAFNTSEIKLGPHPIKNLQTYGYRVEVFYTYPVADIDVRLGLGFKQLFFSGNHDFNNFHGNVTKGSLMLGGLYRWNDHWKTGLALSMENNRDTDSFRSQTTDLFRYNLHLEVNYLLQGNIFLTLNYGKLLHPNLDIYTFRNPTDQVTLGVLYKLPWL